MKHAWDARAAYRQTSDHTRAPVSEQERTTLSKFRATPALEAHLTPTGTVAKEVRRDIETEREARIAFITMRLERQKSRARSSFEHSR